MESKTYTQSKRPLDKNQSSKFCLSCVKQTHFQNLEEKGRSDFFLSQGHLTFEPLLPVSNIKERVKVSVIFSLGLMQLLILP